jgi:hypothetical protein
MIPPMIARLGSIADDYRDDDRHEKERQQVAPTVGGRQSASTSESPAREEPSPLRASAAWDAAAN